MDQLDCIKTFIEVAQAKSFTSAARRRGLSRASATKHVIALEQMLGARLLTRNSQFVSLTDAGEAMLEGGVRILEDLEGLSEMIESTTSGVTGTVRIGTPPSFGAQMLMAAVLAFMEKVPGVDVSLVMDDGSSNLVREGLDISIRIAESLQSTDEVAKFLASAQQVSIASPAYIEKMPPLVTPDDLVHHHCLWHALKYPTASWSFNGPGGPISINIQPRIKSNFGEPLLAAALLGSGISIHPIYMVWEYIKAGKLVVVLPGYEPTRLRIHAIYPQRRFLPARTRIFLDFLKSWLDEHGDRPDNLIY